MPRSTWLNILIILLVILAALYLAQVLFDILSRFSDIILILTLSWLIAYALNPLIDVLNNQGLPKRFVRAFNSPNTVLVYSRLVQFRVNRLLAVALVYLGLVFFVLVIAAAIVPALVTQIRALVPQLSQINVLQATLTQLAEDILASLNIASNVQTLIASAFASLQAYATPILQNTIAILTGVISLLGSALLVILLSFFIALDGPRFGKILFDIVPDRLHQETRMFLITTDRAFGSFLRAQILQAAVVAVGTWLVLGMFDVQAALVSGLFAGLFMLIPLFGPILAVIPPLLATVLTDPDRFFWVMIPVVIMQVVIVNVLMPRIVGNALGLHPLVIIVSLLIGIKIAGFWGAFFAMPLAGILSAFGAFLIRRRQRLADLTSAIIVDDDEPLVTENEAATVLPEPLDAPQLSRK